MKFVTLFIAVVVLYGCSGVDIQRLENSKPLPVPQGVKPQVIGLSNIKTLIPRGEETLGYGPRRFWDLLKCELPWGSVQTTSIGQYVVTGNIRTKFADTLGALGYDVAGNPGLLFNEDEDYMRTRYRIGARIVDPSISMCQHEEFLKIDTRTNGEANIDIEWVVYDGLLKKTVYKTRTKGYGRLDRSYSEGAMILLEDAFASAVHELGTDQVFHDLIFQGITPDMKDNQFGIDREIVPAEDWGERLSIKPQKPLGNDFKAMQKTAVMIETGAGGHGSGFFITDDLILTNAHVVGFADTVRVTLSGKTTYDLARLVRTDRPRDIAILRLVEKQDKKLYAVAPLSFAKPDIGDTVYVVGAPQYKKLQDTLTSGIISAMRYDEKVRQAYIQSDVNVHGGNSGGPLYNKNGQVIGLSVSGFINRDGDPLSGLNWFIPIEDALNKLDVKIQ